MAAIAAAYERFEQAIRNLEHDDVMLCHLRIQYMELRDNINPDKNYLQHRSKFVSLMYNIGADLGMKGLKVLVHIAAALMDRFFTVHPLQRVQQLILVAGAVLSIAGKGIEGSYWNCFRVEDLHYGVFMQVKEWNPRIVQDLSITNMAHAEWFVCDALGWNLNTATPLVFMDVFEAKGLICEGDRQDGKVLMSSAAAELAKKAREFCDACTKEGVTVTHGIALSACASVALARTILKYDETWPDVLYERTEIPYSDIEDCQATLLAHVERQKEEVAARSMKLTVSPAPETPPAVSGPSPASAARTLQRAKKRNRGCLE